MMNFSKAELKQLIGNEFKNYKVQCENKPLAFFNDKKHLFLELVEKAQERKICAFDVNTREFSVRLDGDNFDNALNAIKDFETRVSNLVAEKEHKQKIQSRLDKAANSFNKAFKEYLNALNEAE